ncbi:hypothetical protein LOSG293_110120 [Secundilactobacillus oryzae JCM 18671]|uniref:Uncharacterized protein n=1 Tax=Secundilactobacillus oryzae JCM 18671 TaxID=1291743 RepID=A0A081BI28_9LACO|nr:hypothetical protein [Secundilactobacillus oryzae]GAK47696.1 hypothetical protein LOSG293_110120 [Secundilactobacillus oryzae JCM 18671]
MSNAIPKAHQGFNDGKELFDNSVTWRDMTWKQNEDSYTVKYLITAEGFVLFDGELIPSGYSVFITAELPPEIAALPNLRFYASNFMNMPSYDSISQTTLKLTNPHSIRELILQYDI